MKRKNKIVAFLFVLLSIALVLFLHFYHQIRMMMERPELTEDFLLLRFKNLFALLEFSALNVYVDLLLVIFVLTIEYWTVGWERCSIKKIVNFKSKSLINDIFFMILSLTNGFKFLTVVLTFALGYFAFGLVSDTFQMNLGKHIEFPWLQFVAVSLFSEFIGYWVHRFSHKISWWWLAHRFHHAQEEMSTISYYRVHFIDTALNHFFKVIPFIVFGQSLENYLIYYVMREIHNLLIHSEIKSNWGWVGRYLFVSPMSHRIHHSINEEHHHSNYSNFLVIWDRLFGTFNERNTVFEVGIKENPYNKKGIIHDVLQPYKDIFTSLLFKK